MIRRPNIIIGHLRDRQFALPVLAERFIAEWEPWYGPEGDGDAEADLRACVQYDGLPVCLVALAHDSEVLGTVALRSESVGSELGPGPWLTGLLVAPDARGQGIATALVERLELEAAQLGFKAIYVSTDSAGNIMQRRGWEPVGSSMSLRGEVTVFRRSL